MKAYRNSVQVGQEKLVVVTINQEEGETKEYKKAISISKMHHIHVLDRSGSMYSSINQLIDNVQKSLEYISDEDLVSIIWFASPGQSRTLVKGAKKSPELINMLNDLRSVMGCTCFSEPIQEVSNIVKELKSLCPTISVTLFTDGCAVVPWADENDRVYSILREMKDNIIAFNTVGYGYYYNQDFLKRLANMTEFGIFTHSQNLDEYITIFKNNFERISSVAIETINIQALTKVKILYLNRNFSKSTYGVMQMDRLDKNKNQFFLVCDKDFTFEYNGQKIYSADLKSEAGIPTIENFFYAMAYNEYYHDNPKVSLSSLMELGDKALVDSHMSAFTVDEKANHLKKLEDALFNTSYRNKDGKCKKNYLPAPDAFCVMDLLKELAAKDAYFLPFHAEADEYKRVGKKTVDLTDFFTPDFDSVMTKMGDFVFNDTRVNLSIRYILPGVVSIDKAQAEKVGISNAFDAYTFRNYTIIKDGFLNAKSICCLIPDSLFHDLVKIPFLVDVIKIDAKKLKELSNDTGMKYTGVKLNLLRIPVINQLYNNSMSVEKIFDLAKFDLENQCELKVLKFYMKNIETGFTAAQKKVGIMEGKTAAQIAVMEAHGLQKDGTYRPLSTSQKKKDDCDFYTTREFEFGFKGFSKLPWPSDYEKKNGVGLTISERMMYGADLAVKGQANLDNIDLTKSIKETKIWLETHMKEIRKEIFDHTAKMAALKMAKLLTGDSFEGFTPDDKKLLCYEKDEMTMYLKTKTAVEYL